MKGNRILRIGAWMRMSRPKVLAIAVSPSLQPTIARLVSDWKRFPLQRRWRSDLIREHRTVSMYFQFRECEKRFIATACRPLCRERVLNLKERVHAASGYEES